MRKATPPLLAHASIAMALLLVLIRPGNLMDKYPASQCGTPLSAALHSAVRAALHPVPP